MATDFTNLNIMVGTARSLDQAELSDDETEIYDRDFDLLAKELAKIDPELGNNLANEKEFYLGVCQIAKGYFDKPFGGLKSTTGQFGMSFIYPQILKDAAAGTNTNFYSWRKTVTTDSGDTDADILGGTTGSTWAYTESTAEEKTVVAFHQLLSYIPNPRILMIEMNVNDYPYQPWSVEPYAKITKADKLYKLLPMPGRVIIHPGGKFYIRGWFDLQSSTAPSGTTSIDVELAPFGIAFAEYNQFAVANLI